MVPRGGAKVEIVPEAPVSVVAPACRVEDGGGVSYQGEYTGRTAFGVVPLPVTGHLHISVQDGQPNPFRITIPVTVWPSSSTLALWWLVAYLGIVGVRWQGTVAHGNSAFAVFAKIRGDISYLGELLLLGVVVAVLLRVLGWIVTLAAPGDGR